MPAIIEAVKRAQPYRNITMFESNGGNNDPATPIRASLSVTTNQTAWRQRILDCTSASARELDPCSMPL